MGKPSIARELGRRMEEKGWTQVFADVENASSPEDTISELPLTEKFGYQGK